MYHFERYKLCLSLEPESEIYIHAKNVSIPSFISICIHSLIQSRKNQIYNCIEHHLSIKINKLKNNMDVISESPAVYFAGTL